MSVQAPRQSQPPPLSAPLWIGITVGTGLLFLLHTAHFDHFADDAYISLRYADNWLRGDGLVFNTGERVLGYSNFLWVMLLSIVGAAGAPLAGAAYALGLAFSLASIVIVSKHVAASSGSALATASAALWLAASGPFALWAGAGLEGPLFAFFLLIATLGAQRIARARAPGSALSVTCAALVAATLTRPEGAGYAIALGGWVALRISQERRTPGALISGYPALACMASGVLAWLAFAAFAWTYYGDPLPNTYYAKSHPLSPELLQRASLYSLAYLKAHLFAPALVIAFFVATHARSPRSDAWAVLFAIAAFLAYYVRIGGDALVYYRMWAWTQPLFALLLASTVASLQRAGRMRPFALAGLALPLLCLPNSFRGFEIEYLRADDYRIRSLAALGRELRDLPPETRLATNVIGAIGFESRLHVVDMLGLTDAHIASAPGKTLGTPGHESHDGRYVLDQQPDLIFVGIPRAAETPLTMQMAFQPNFPSDRDLAEDPRLASDYAFQHLQLPEPDGRVVAAFVRRGYLGLGGGASSPTR